MGLQFIPSSQHLLKTKHSVVELYTRHPIDCIRKIVSLLLTEQGLDQLSMWNQMSSPSQDRMMQHVITSILSSKMEIVMVSSFKAEMNVKNSLSVVLLPRCLLHRLQFQRCPPLLLREVRPRHQQYHRCPPLPPRHIPRGCPVETRLQVRADRHLYLQVYSQVFYRQ